MNSETTFGQLSVGSSFRLAELPGRGRPAIFTKKSGRSYETRSGKTVTTRQNSLRVVKL